MTPEEKAKKIEAIYDEAMKKLETLGLERQGIIRNYVKELESQKISTIRDSLGLVDNK